MAYDIEQQESLANLKAWFDSNANWILGALIVVALGVGGNWGWRWYQAKEANAASLLYEQYEQAYVAKDATKERAVAASLTQQFPSTAYASFAAMNQARVSLDAGDNAAAKAQLQWVIDKSGNKEFKALARVRLAGILLDEKAYEQGLALLQEDAPPALAAEFSDRRGDLLFAQGKVADARAAYTKALEQASAQNPLRPLIQSKLDALPAAG
jgi:predicted negative regulator of RcsB-dependent stress response